MNSFGLGLVLNFTDNASSGMRRVSQTFNEMNGLATQMIDSSNSALYSIQTLSLAGMGLSMVGEQMSDMGNSIVSLFTGVSESVINTGMTMQGFRMQLQALYGEASYEQKLQEIKQYAKDSVFEVQGLMSAVTLMKAVGIEAMDEVTTSSGKTTQKLLDYASDIAAMFPSMRNAYGTGVNAAMGALKEYIAEGNALTLKRSAGLDIEGILGEDKGKTMEERTQQVADLIEMLGIAGYTTALVGTPTQQLAKMQDILFNAMSDIADSGVFEKYTELLSKAATWVDNLANDTERYNSIISIVSDTILAVLTPLEYLLDTILNLADAFIDWADSHPTLAKGVLITVAAVGALLVVFGQVLKLAGSFFMLTSGLMQMSQLAKTGISVFNIFGRAIGGVTTNILPFIALASVVYYAWESNLFGIRDTATQVLKDLGSIFSIVSDAWGDNTLSDENFKKANELGILPLIEGLLQLKYYWGFLVEGFKTGFKAFFEGLAESLNQLGIFDIDITEIIATLGEFLRSLVDIGAEDKWTKLGENLGKIAGGIIAFTVAINALKGVFSFFTGIAAIFSVIGTVFKLVFGLGKILFNPIILIAPKVIAFFRDFGAAIALMKEGFGFFAVMGAWFPKLAGIISAIGGAFAKVGGIFKAIGGAIMGVLSAIATALNIPVWAVVALIAVIISLGITIYESLGTIVNYVTTTLGDIFGGIVTIFTGIIDFFKGVFTGDWDMAWRGIVSIFDGVWQTLVGIVKGVVNGIILVVNTLISTLYRILASVVNGIGSIFGSIASALGFEDMGFSIPKTPPQIPYLAEGGVVTQPTTAVIGEGEDKEAVLPLNDNVFREIAEGINKNRPVTAQPTVQNDYSVTFSAGSIVIQLTNATEAELERAAEKLMKIIERKQKLKAMAVRKAYAQSKY